MSWFTRRRKTNVAALQKQRDLAFVEALWDWLTWNGVVDWKYVRTTTKLQLPNGCEAVVTIKEQQA